MQCEELWSNDVSTGKIIQYIKSDRDGTGHNRSLTPCNSIKPSAWVRLFTKTSSNNILPKKALLRIYLLYYCLSVPLNIHSAPLAPFSVLHWINWNSVKSCSPSSQLYVRKQNVFHWHQEWRLKGSEVWFPVGIHQN